MSMIIGYMMPSGRGWRVECVNCAKCNDITVPIYDTSVPSYNYQTCHECGMTMIIATPSYPEVQCCELHPNPNPNSMGLDEPFEEEEPDPFASAMEQFNRPTDPAPPLILEEYIDTLPAIKAAEPISGVEGIEW